MAIEMSLILNIWLTNSWSKCYTEWYVFHLLCKSKYNGEIIAKPLLKWISKKKTSRKRKVEGIVGSGSDRFSIKHDLVVPFLYTGMSSTLRVSQKSKKLRVVFALKGSKPYFSGFPKP